MHYGKWTITPDHLGPPHLKPQRSSVTDVAGDLWRTRGREQSPSFIRRHANTCACFALLDHLWIKRSISEPPDQTMNSSRSRHWLTVFCISEWRNNLDKIIRWTVNLNIFCHIKQKLITQCNKILLLFLLHILIFSFKQLSQHCASGPVRFRYQNHLLLIKDCVLSWNTFYKLNIVETLSQKIIFLQCLMSKLYLNLLSHSIHITNYCFSCV